MCWNEKERHPLLIILLTVKVDFAIEDSSYCIFDGRV